MGEQAWRESGLGAPAEQEELQRQVSRLEQANTELLARLEERNAELEAARAANREPTRALNQKGAADRWGLAGPVVRLPAQAALG